MLRSILGAFSAYPFKKILVYLLVLRIRNNIKADHEIVFDFTFPFSVLDFIIVDIFQLKKLPLAKWDPSCENCPQASLKETESSA